MEKSVRLASFCRLCLTKTTARVPVFAEGNLLDKLLSLIEIQIDPDDEPDAVVCYDCVVTLEGFHQFKEQCHVNDEFVKTLPPKAHDPGSSDGEETEQIDREDSPVEVCLEEEDQLELSEAEEVFSELPIATKSSRSKRKSSGRSSRKTPTRKSVKKVPQARTKKKAKSSVTVRKKSAKPSLDELQVLQESYPDYFYFEKGRRSINYTLVFYGERFNSAVYAERYTYWQCIHRCRYSCPAKVRVSNDYKKLERHYEHTHEPLRDKDGEAFTPKEALPEIFKVCKRVVENAINRKKLKCDAKEETSETTQDITEESNHDDLEKGSSSSKAKKTPAEIYSSDSDTESDSVSDS